MQKYRMLLQYLGTRYAGWQVQKGRPTVQQLLQEALEQISGERVSVVGSGRTDSGVHALGQVAHFRLSMPREVPRLEKALNGVLPWDVRVLRLREAPAGFHAQRDARRKRYLYRIHNGPVLPPFLYGRVFHARRPLDAALMQAGAEGIRGRHDFSGFAASRSRVRDKRRTVSLSRVCQRGHYLDYCIEGDGFLHHMVRNIAGTLLEVGWRRRPPEDVRRILEARDRRLAGPTAAARGLYLARVWY